MRHRNLEVRTRTLATRILFEGKRAVGVEYLRAGGFERARAAEVIRNRWRCPAACGKRADR